MIFHAEKLEEVHPDLVKVIKEYGETNDIVIVCGRRSKAEQDEAYSKGNSRCKWPNSVHNLHISLGVDIAPTKDNGKTIDWKDTDAFKRQVDGILDIAAKHKIKVIPGMSFSGLVDYPHFQLPRGTQYT